MFYVRASLTLNYLFQQYKAKYSETHHKQYTPAKISSTIHFHLEHHKQRSILKLVNKPKATWLVFATEKVTFNRKKVLNVLDTFNLTQTKTLIIKKPKTPKKKNKKRKNQKNNWGCNNFK